MIYIFDQCLLFFFFLFPPSFLFYVLIFLRKRTILKQAYGQSVCECLFVCIKPALGKLHLIIYFWAGKRSRFSSHRSSSFTVLTFSDFDLKPLSNWPSFIQKEKSCFIWCLCRVDVCLFSLLLSLANLAGVTKISNFLGVPDWSSIKLDYSSFLWPLRFYGLNEKQNSHSSTTIVLEGSRTIEYCH